jgi:hypothetical protein
VLPQKAMKTIQLVLDALCWTPIAKIIRYTRMKKINKTTSENYDIKKINELLNKILKVHGDMLS